MARKRKNANLKQILAMLFIILCFMGLAYSNDSYNNENTINNTASNYNNLREMPEYFGQIYVTINNNIP